MRIRVKMLLAAGAALCAAAAAPATTLARLSLDQLAAAADAVARVRCEGTEARFENGDIWTLTTFEVLETLKGALPPRIIVRLPGGRMGHRIATVDGTPRFGAGEEAVVFLERSRAGGFTIAGWVEGTFRIRRDSGTGRERVTQDSSAFAVFDPATRTFRAEGIRQMPIEQFREQVAAAIARAKEGAR